MPETRRFDPLGWFLSTCIAVLIGAVALSVAIHLIAAIWVWLALGIGLVVILGTGAQLVAWWRRRQPW